MELSFVVAFVHAHMDIFIRCGFTTLGHSPSCGTIAWPARRRRLGFSKGFREKRKTVRVGDLNGNHMTRGKAIIKAQHGDKEHSRGILQELEEARKESGSF